MPSPGANRFPLDSSAAPLPRLYIAEPLRSREPYECTQEQSHYLAHVLRLKPGTALRVFDGKSGIFTAHLSEIAKRSVTLTIGDLYAPFTASRDVTLCFAPIKRDHLEWLVQKATELGVRNLFPVMTQRTIGGRTNFDRLRTIAIEAAEQSERHDIPDICPPAALADMLSAWPKRVAAGEQPCPLYACLEREDGRTPPLAQALAASRRPEPAAFLIGPEGGFSDDEKQLLSRTSFVRPVSLGSGILRAETAGLVALALWQARMNQSAAR